MSKTFEWFLVHHNAQSSLTVTTVVSFATVLGCHATLLWVRVAWHTSRVLLVRTWILSSSRTSVAVSPSLQCAWTTIEARRSKRINRVLYSVYSKDWEISQIHWKQKLPVNTLLNCLAGIVWTSGHKNKKGAYSLVDSVLVVLASLNACECWEAHFLIHQFLTIIFKCFFWKLPVRST